MHEEPTDLSGSRAWERKQDSLTHENKLGRTSSSPRRQKPVTEEQRHQHGVNPGFLSSLSCWGITVGGKRQQNTRSKPPAPELKPMMLLVLAKVTQPLCLMLLPPYQCLLAGAWPRPLHPDPSHPVASQVQLASSRWVYFPLDPDESIT